jgi:hypothetical protein
MSKALFTLTLLASATTLPLTAHADSIDDFVLTGNGHTITYSLPATSSNLDFHTFSFFEAGGPAAIDGVPGYVESGRYNVFGDLFPVTLVLDVYTPDFVFDSVLNLGGSRFYSFVIEPASNPQPYLPDDVVLTFIPGTYSLQGLATFGLEPLDPPVDYTLTITQEGATAATPEPSSLALLTTGTLGLIAFATKRKKTHALFTKPPAPSEPTLPHLTVHPRTTNAPQKDHKAPCRAIGSIPLLAFAAFPQKPHVKPPSHLTQYKPITSACPTSYIQTRKLDIQSQ